MDKKDVNDLKELILATQVISISMTTLWGLTNYCGDVYNKENIVREFKLFNRNIIIRNTIYFDIALLTTTLVASINLYRNRI